MVVTRQAIIDVKSSFTRTGRSGHEVPSPELLDLHTLEKIDTAKVGEMNFKYIFVGILTRHRSALSEAFRTARQPDVAVLPLLSAEECRLLGLFHVLIDMVLLTAPPSLDHGRRQDEFVLLWYPLCLLTIPW